MRLKADSRRGDEASPSGGAQLLTGEQDRGRRTGKGFSWTRVARGLALAVMILITLLTSAWASMTLYFDAPFWKQSLVSPTLYLILIASVWILFRYRGIIAFALSLAFFGVVCVWWLFIPPSNHRDWQPDVAVTPYAEEQGSKVTIRNIRSCEYRSETDYDVRHYDKIFDLGALRTVDLYLVYWGSPHIAHTMASFGFGDDQYVCISIETRKEKGEAYSALRGFFRQFELIYVIGDERDLVRLRTNYRNEKVHLYRIRAPAEQVRALFLDYLRTANELHRKARWYNALTDNCTTGIRMHSDQVRGHRIPLDWRVILNGHSDEMLYERGRIDNSIPFEELKRRSTINERARAASEEHYSAEIRRGLPGISL